MERTELLLRRFQLHVDLFKHYLELTLKINVAFYAISGIWARFDPKTIDYAYHFACWTVAFLPGFLALIVTRRS